jgi:hypothetical protein
MSKKINLAAGASALIGISLISAAGWGPTASLIGDGLISRFPGESASANDGRDEPGRKQFSEAEALGIMTETAARRIEETIGRPQPTESGEALVAEVEGRALSLADLELTELTFVPATLRAETSAGTFSEFVEPTDAWVAVWTRSGVTAPDWGVPADIRVVAIMKDGSGDIRSLHVMRVNPAAEEAQQD